MCDGDHGSALERVQAILARLCAHEPNSPDLLWELLKSCSPAVVLDTRYALIDGRIYQGRKGVEQFFEEWLSAWRKWAWTAIDLFDTPHGVCVLVEERAESRSRVPVKQQHIQEWTLDGDRVIRWRIYAHDFVPPFESETTTEVAA